ncbi:hypothetical protein GJ496_010486 [Pomphorhynchus laevis]|nr:hypothetical protein GJ496_010486 [Pomphorhynchus laevis]
MPSYIESSDRFIHRLESIKIHIDEETMLATMDVDLLYTSIDHEVGVNALLYCMRRRDWPNNKINFVKGAIEIV